MTSQIEMLDLDALPAREKGDVEMVDLFHLGGRTYQIPAEPRVNLALKFLWQRKTRGELDAAANLLGDMLGAEAFEALMEWPGLTVEILNQVSTAAAKVAMGQMEQAVGNSGGGQSK
jgi:hypothetical protein